MSEQIRDLFARRMEIVQEIARLNARQLHDQQMLGGRQLELAACEENAQCDTATLHAARAQVEETVAQLATDTDELDAWHARLDEVDRRIAEA